MAIKFLSEIIQTIRERGDFRNPIKFTDAIITKEAQSAFDELYQLISETCQGYFDIYGNVVTRSTADFVALPSDAWIVRAIDILDSTGCPTPLRQVGIEERNRYGLTRGKPCEYRLTARGIDLYPPPDAAYALRVLYTPSAPVLASPVFVGSSTATFTTPLDAAVGTVTTPSDVALGDMMLIAVAADGIGSTPPVPPDGFHEVFTLELGGAREFALFRRVADGTELSAYDVTMANFNFACSVVLLVYRNIDPSANIVDSDIEEVATSKSFVCPSLEMEATNDLYIGVTWSASGATSFAHPFGSRERFDESQSSDGTPRQIGVFDVQPGVIGESGTRTSISTNTLTGFAVSFALKVNPFRDFFNGWDEYMIYGALLRLSSQEEAMRGDWQVAQDRARTIAVRGASARRSAEPQLIPLMEDAYGGYYGW